MVEDTAAKRARQVQLAIAASLQLNRKIEAKCAERFKHLQLLKDAIERRDVAAFHRENANPS
jgi:hypothetical protein